MAEPWSIFSDPSEQESEVLKKCAPHRTGTMQGDEHWGFYWDRLALSVPVPQWKGCSAEKTLYFFIVFYKDL